MISNAIHISTELSTLKKTIFALLIVFCLSVASDVEASTEYSQLIYGENVGEFGYQGLVYQPGSSIAKDYTALAFKVVNAIDRIETPVPDAGCASLNGLGITSTTTGSIDRTLTGGTLVGGICRYTISGGASNLPVGYAFNGFSFGGVQYIPKGSFLNDGVTWDTQHGDAKYTDGGMAFQLCATSCTEAFEYNTIDESYTHIISFTPENNDVYATSSTRDGVEGATTTISVYFYINEDDVGTFEGITTKIENDDQNTVLSNFLGISDYKFVDTCDTSLNLDFTCDVGINHYEKEIWLPTGNYIVHVSMQGSFLTIVNPFTSGYQNASESQDETNPVAQYHQYTIGGGTFLGRLRQSTTNQLENVLSDPASTNTPSIVDCAVTDFHFKDCLVFALIPTTADLKHFGDTISLGVLSKFPLGYVWNIYQVLISTSSLALPVVDATVPNGVIGTGAHIRLEISSTTLAYLWNATTSTFVNSSAPSTETYLQIVSYYWNIVVYMAVLMYILRRILGTGLIGDVWNVESEPFKEGVRYIKSKRTPKDVRDMKINNETSLSPSEWENQKRNRLL